MVCCSITILFKLLRIKLDFICEFLAKVEVIKNDSND